ncbi:MAG: hypothetical protein HRF50_03730 [Phycisphaerae bacterium]|jgi:predicted anti-sigma-YlaC factor YlaD
MRHLQEIELIALASGRAADDAAQAHLEACEPCRRRFDAVRRTYDALGAWTAEPAAGELWPAVQRRLLHRPAFAERSGRGRVIRLLRVAAAIVIGVGLGHGAGRLWSPARTASSPPATDVGEALALYALENPSPTGLVMILGDDPGVGNAEGVP